jgi:DNA-binding transcriptional regulator LsrR (DeoR family)
MTSHQLLEQKFRLAQVIIARAPNESEESMRGAAGAAAAYFLGTTLRPKVLANA